MILLALTTPLASQQLGWQVREVLRFSDAPPDIAFGRIAGVAVDSAGAIYVLDPMNSAIYVFGPSGRHHRTIGRRGEGPGELSRFVQALAVGDTLVLVVDVGNQRVSRWRLDGTFLDDVPMTLTAGAPVGARLLPGGDLVVQHVPTPLPPALAAQIGLRDTEPALLRYRPDGSVRDTLFVFRYQAPVVFEADGSMTTRVPEVMPVWGTDGQGRLVIGHTDRYELRTWNGRAFGAPWGRDIGRLPVTRAMRERAQRSQDSLRARLQGGPMQMNRGIEMPDSQPAMQGVRAGPFGTTLVSRPSGEADGRRIVWDVFGPDGRFTGTWRPPAGFRLHAARGDRLYGVELDEDDLPYLVVYAIER